MISISVFVDCYNITSIGKMNRIEFFISKDRLLAQLVKKV